MTDHPERLNGLRSLLRDQGMNVQQFHSHFPFAADSEENRTVQVERNKRTIDLAAELCRIGYRGTPFLSVHLRKKVRGKLLRPHCVPDLNTGLYG